MTRLRVSEIFHSLQGESSTVGFRTVFVRLTGCPLRCGYCDTSYAFRGGRWMSLERILQQVASYQPLYVTVTGGEPLAQRGSLELMTALCDADYRVSLETAGALDIAPVDPRVVRVMDLKTPGSQEMERNLPGNIEHLRPTDQVKFVICHLADYEWAREQLVRWSLDKRCEVLFSPAQGTQAPGELADWIVRDRLPVRFQIQLHKYLWGDLAGR